MLKEGVVDSLLPAPAPRVGALLASVEGDDADQQILFILAPLGLLHKNAHAQLVCLETSSLCDDPIGVDKMRPSALFVAVEENGCSFEDK